MESQQHDIINQIWAFFAKTWTWFFYITIGLIGKLGLMIRDDKKANTWAMIGSVMLAGCVGYLAAIYCMANYPAPEGGYSSVGAIVVPMATLLSDKVITILLNLNWTPIIEAISGLKNKK